MKKTVLTLVLALAFMPVFSQATLQHSFPNHGGDLHPIFQNSIREYVYEVLPEMSYILAEYTEDGILTGFSVYDDNYELTKEIPFTLEGSWITSFTGFYVVIAGRHLFNADDKMEIGLTIRPKYAGVTAVTVFLNEDGEILFKEEGCLLNGVYRIGEELRFDLVDYGENYNLEIYATQGNFSADEMVVSTQSPYPNPASMTVSIPYTFDGKSAEMHIYDSRGVLMDTKTLNPDAEWIDINVSNYRPGIYIYEYNGASNKFVVR